VHRFLVVQIPGPPCAQGRPRAFRTKGGAIRTFDPARSRSWKGAAQVHYQEALRAAEMLPPAFPVGPVAMSVVAVFACPKGAHRRVPLPRRRKAGRPDADNLAKAAMDAANGLLFADDSQVAKLVVHKFVGAQGEAPYVVVRVEELEGEEPNE